MLEEHPNPPANGGTYISVIHNPICESGILNFEKLVMHQEVGHIKIPSAVHKRGRRMGFSLFLTSSSLVEEFF